MKVCSFIFQVQPQFRMELRGQGELASSVEHLPVRRSGAGGVDVELREFDAVVMKVLLLL